MKCRFLVGAALLAIACSSQAAVVYGDNLVVNGDAEAGTAGWTGYAGYDIFQSVNYGSNWVLPTQPGPVDRGDRDVAHPRAALVYHRTREGTGREALGGSRRSHCYGKTGRPPTGANGSGRNHGHPGSGEDSPHAWSSRSTCTSDATAR